MTTTAFPIRKHALSLLAACVIAFSTAPAAAQRNLEELTPEEQAGLAIQQGLVADLERALDLMEEAQARGLCQPFRRIDEFWFTHIDGLAAANGAYRDIRGRLLVIRARGCVQSDVPVAPPPPEPPHIDLAEEESTRNAANLEAARSEFRQALFECDAAAFTNAQKGYVAALALSIGEAAFNGDEDLRTQLRSEQVRIAALQPRACTPAAVMPATPAVTPSPNPVESSADDVPEPLGPTSEQEYQQAGRYEELRYLQDAARQADNAHASAAQQCDRAAMDSRRAQLKSIYGEASTLVTLIAYYQEQNGATGRRSDFPSPEVILREILVHDENARTRPAQNCPTDVEPQADGEWGDDSIFDELESSDQGPMGSYSEMFEMWERVAGPKGTPAEQLAAARRAAASCDRTALAQIVGGMRDLYPALEQAVEEHGPNSLTRDYTLSIVVQGRDDMLAALTQAQQLQLDCPTVAEPARPTPTSSDGNSAANKGPQTTTFAVSITDYRVGDPQSTVSTPTRDGIGAPDGNGLSFGCGGSAVYRFGAGVLDDVSGNDIKLYGLGPGGEVVLVELSSDGQEWVRVGIVSEDAAVDIGPYVRAGAPFRLIRLTDRTGGCGAGQWPGAEIDTVGAAITIAPDQALTRRLEAIVAADSIGWRSNRYLAGSMRNARVTEGNFASGTFSVRGDYTYNEDSSGWVIAKFVGGQLSCLQYHDIGATCRAPH